MLLVDNVDSKKFLNELFNALYDEIPAPKKEEGNSNFLNFDSNLPFGFSPNKFYENLLAPMFLPKHRQNLDS